MFKRFGKFLTAHVFTDDNLVKAHQVDTWLKPLGSTCGSIGRILTGFGAMYTLCWAKQRYEEQRREVERKQIEHELKLRRMYREYSLPKPRKEGR